MKCDILSFKSQDLAQYLQGLRLHSSEMYYTQPCARAGKQVFREHRFPDQKLRWSQAITEGLSQALSPAGKARMTAGGDSTAMWCPNWITVRWVSLVASDPPSWPVVSQSSMNNCLLPWKLQDIYTFFPVSELSEYSHVHAPKLHVKPKVFGGLNFKTDLKKNKIK